METTQLLALYRAMFTARKVDDFEQQLTSRGEAFFNVSGAGHESSAALAFHLRDSDWLHCHYRDKALMIARGLNPAEFLDSLLCKDTSQSRGRQMSAFLSSAELNIISQGTPVGNSTLHAVGVAAAIRERDDRPIVVTSAGDGTTQEGEYLEACAEAARSHLPVLFLIEDNQWSISTHTPGKTFFSLSHGDADSFHGIPIVRMDGRDAAGVLQQIGPVIDDVRHRREPVFVVLRVERLASHTHADDHRVYRAAEQLQSAAETGDPLPRLKQCLLDQGQSVESLEELEQQVQVQLEAAEKAALLADDPTATATAKRPLRVELTHPAREIRGDEQDATLPMKDAMCEVLRQKLRDDQRVFLYGQDIEDPKGDVFGVTKGLSTEFGGRVQNAPLAEATIVGTAIGRALAGQRPVAFLQFADFMPLAYNQIACELGNIYWRTDGDWQVPVIIMIPCGGYRPGLGPFHAHTLESIAAHTPGLDVLMPATATDAAGMLNTAFESQNPTLFFYPKSCLNDPQISAPTAVQDLRVPLGVARKVRSGRDVTLVCWGNTVRLCRKVAESLEQAGFEAEILDLRSISPWDKHAVITSAEKTARLIVVHEDNQTCGMGAEVLATVAEKARMPVAMRRVTRPDTYVPMNFENQLEILPSYKRILETSAELLDLDISWTPPAETTPGEYLIQAIGSGPSDETVEVVELHQQVGGQVEPGDVVATLEATKSVFELTSSVSGTVGEILVAEGDTILVGAPLFRVYSDNVPTHRKPLTFENPGTPVMARKRKTETVVISPRRGERREMMVGMSSVATVVGSREITNEQLVSQNPKLSAEDIVRRTGIESRHWVSDETAIDMAVRSCWQLLDREGLIVDDLDSVICATTSPTVASPSMACQVLSGLANGRTSAMVQAHDINAACSGYLYALQSGYDYLQSSPQGRVLIVTAEVLSPLLDLNDLDTAIIFGDAASATILYGEQHMESAKMRLMRPELSARGEDGSVLSVPFPTLGHIQMQGRRVFSEAVRTMLSSLNRVCDRQEMSLEDLSMVVPHQANGRIIEAMRNRVNVNVYNNIRHHGNTSSSSIPLCLIDVLPQLQPKERIALCAFGGGFTFGAALLEAA
jgi:2-oxoisovalerate dehydrogenase E1 component